MHELLNIRTGKVIAFAEDVWELNAEQYLFYLNLVLENIAGNVTDPQDIKMRLFAHLTDLKLGWKLAFRKMETEEAVWSALTDKINLLDSFFDIEENDMGKKLYNLHIKCTKNLLPEYKKYKGPDNFLNDIRWYQFKNALNAMKMLDIAMKEKNVVEIAKYTSDIFYALYTKPPKAKYIQLPDTVQYHALMYFSYWYELITTTPIEINGEEIDFAILWKTDPDAPQNEKDKSGWLGITFAIAESGVFGTNEDVDNEKLLNVLMLIYRNKINELNEKENQKKQAV